MPLKSLFLTDLETAEGKVVAIVTYGLSKSESVEQFDYLTSSGFRLDLTTGIYNRIEPDAP